jgi:hypothetical protein
MSHYNDAVLDLTRTETPDPYVTYSDATRKFYLVSDTCPYRHITTLTGT